MVSKRLTSIQFPDPYLVEFVYTAADRVDFPGDKALTELNVSYLNKPLYGYRFNYGYFFKSQIVPLTNVFQAQDKRFARLFLKDFKKVGADGTALPAHEFTYNMPSGVGRDIIPPMYSLFTDHWGYYNPNHSFIQEDADGFPASELQAKSFTNYSLLEAKYGIIKTVKYPEGGTLEWQYEGNQAENSPFTGKYAGGVRVLKTKVFDGVTHENDIIKDYKYVKVGGASSAWGFEVPYYTETRAVRQYKLNGTYNQGNNFKDMAANFVTKIFYNAPNAIYTQSVSGGMFGHASISDAAYDVMVVYVIAQIIDIIFLMAIRTFPFRSSKTTITIKLTHCPINIPVWK
ncbi:hypothetical protein [Paraflavitalea speifideaquila]|uniref:hypothetical protein n=1 Tax=Paraflavitalea speifideaquila TaxID=3076558 RepID=UPI0028E70539|nr:hypothetical protein [Paraflavitalea speifideiaquila]